MTSAQPESILDVVPVSVAWVGAGLDVGFANQAFATMFGAARDRAAGRRFADLLGEPCFRALAPLVERALAGSEVSEELLLPANGRAPRWFHCVLMPAPASSDGGGFVACLRDVTDRRASQEALLEHSNLLHRVLEAMTDPIFVKDVEGRYLMMNSAGARLFGLTPQEILGKDDYDLFPPDVAADVRAHDARVLASAESVTIEEVMVQLGSTRNLLTTKDVYRRHDGTVSGVIGIARDVTEIAQKNRELRKWGNVIRNADWGVAISEADAKTLAFLNPAFAAMHGYTVEELTGRPIADVFAAEYREEAERQILLAQQRGRHSWEAINLRKDGTAFPAAIDITSVRDESGELLYRAFYALDVTERRRAEQAQRESEQRFARILESAMDAIVTVDKDLVVQVFNAAAEDVFQCPAAEAVGQPFSRFASPQLIEVLTGCVRAFGRSSARKRYLWAPEGLTALRASGEEFPVESTISTTDAGNRKLYTIILRDVNDREQAQREMAKLRHENVLLRAEVGANSNFGEIVGTSATIEQVLEAARQVAATDTTVLITGETGTGKELIARAIHEHSARKDSVFVTVNCAALPPSLIESELFGHEKGAFTGALAQKIGRFELADGGTIFLDEIGDLPIELQAKLLRVLQEREFERLGSAQPRRIDVRMIAATNRDLERAVAEGEFRADLFYRLNVFPIHVPPLRERRQDIPALVSHFAMQHGARMGKRIEQIPKAAMKVLTDYDWPGNVRELQNIVERALIVSRGPVLEIGKWFQRADAAPAGKELPTLEELDRQHIRRVLDATGWRVSGARGAARVLGLKPTTLESKMKKLGIRRPG